MVGVTGVQGVTGHIGGTGSQGLTGTSGVTGLTGITGVQGVTGLIGLTGAQGVTGIRGKGMNLRYNHNLGVPSVGTRYLYAGVGTLSSNCGDRIPVASTLSTITVEVDVIDASRTFTIEIISDPTATPVVIDSLTLPLSSRGATTTALTANIAADTEIGARIVRATGTGGSSFNHIVVNIILLQ